MSGGKATNLTCIWTFFPSKIFPEFLQGEIFVQEWVYSIGAVLLKKADYILEVIWAWDAVLGNTRQVPIERNLYPYTQVTSI